MTLEKVVDVVDSSVRFERRRWSQRKAWRPLLIGAIAVTVLVFGVWVVLFSTWLGMRHLQVVGLHRVTPAEVAAAADVAPGTPLARVDLEAVRARIEAIPAVESATVNRGWPHSVDVTVHERQPVAAVHARGRWWSMDRTGVLFGASLSPDPAMAIVEIDAGGTVATRRQAAAVLGALPPDLRDLTKRVSAAFEDSITLHLSDGAQVRWGNASASAQKAAVLRALLPRKARYYDVSVPSQPAVIG